MATEHPVTEGSVRQVGGLEQNMAQTNEAAVQGKAPAAVADEANPKVLNSHSTLADLSSSSPRAPATLRSAHLTSQNQHLWRRR